MPAWERWHPGALHTAAPAPVERRAAPSPEVIERHAYAKGLEQGKKDGYKAGMQAGYEEGRARAKAEAAQIHAVANAAQAALQALGDSLANKTVALAVAIAQKIMQREIQSCPESLLDVVRDALTLLPDASGHVRIIVNTEDAALVREAMAADALVADCAVAGSDDMPRGGCRIVAPGGDIDATLDTRISRVLEALGLPLEAAL